MKEDEKEFRPVSLKWFAMNGPLLFLILARLAWGKWRKIAWRCDLVGWMLWFGYVRFWQWWYAWKWSGEECWMAYYEDGLTPFGAILEDASYG